MKFTVRLQGYCEPFAICGSSILVQTLIVLRDEVNHRCLILRDPFEGEASPMAPERATATPKLARRGKELYNPTRTEYHNSSWTDLWGMRSGLVKNQDRKESLNKSVKEFPNRSAWSLNEGQVRSLGGHWGELLRHRPRIAFGREISYLFITEEKKAKSVYL